MTLNRILLPGVLAVLATVLMTFGPASAQEGVFFARQTNWLDISHGACVTRANRSIQTINSSFGLRVPITLTDGWLVGGNTADANVTIGCVSDNDSLQLDSEYAARVLVVMQVSSRDELLGIRVRDQMRDCFFSGECSVTDSGAAPVFAPEVNVVRPAQDPTTFGRRRAAATVVQLNWNSHAVDYREQIGTEFTFNCPELGLASFGRVWGTEVYTTDSSICTAAVHAGVLTDAGGRVAIQIVDGRSAYDATENNGVTTLPYGPWNSSFIFVDLPPEPARLVAPDAEPQAESEPAPALELDADFGLELEPITELDE